MSDSADLTEEKQTRREMLCSLVRYLTFGGMGLVWAILYARSARSSAANSCTQPIPCGDCGLLERCNRPDAVKTREGDKRQ